jgi:hypothetical protein
VCRLKWRAERLDHDRERAFKLRTSNGSRARLRYSLRGSRPRLESMSAINNACSIKGDVKEHFSPCTGGVDVFRDIQPLSPRRTLVWCRAPWFGLFHISGFIFLGCDDAGGF